MSTDKPGVEPQEVSVQSLPSSLKLAKMNAVSAVLENNNLRSVLGNILSHLDRESAKRASQVSR